MKFLLLSAALTISAGAVPVNDLFASRIALPNAAEASASGVNVGATLQAGENDLDSIGGASVWWKWTAPASGWVSVDTHGSAIDTVLAVLADGLALKDTYVVGFNDESGAPGAPQGESRVIFRATAGTEYHLAVHGFLGAQGDVTVNVHAGVTPPLRITSLVLTPAAVNVTTASQTVTVDIGIESEAAFAEGSLALHRANFSGVTEIPVLPANRISGTATAGGYRVTVTVPRYSSPGTWLLEAAVSDAAGREAVFGRGVSAAFEYDHVLPDGLTGLLPVTNTGAVDDLSPALASFARTPSAVNVVTAPAALSFTFRITDALSGFGGATLTLYAPSGESLTALPVTAAHRTLGSALDGTYTVPFSLPARMPGGTWSVSLLVRDAAGNPSLFDGGVNGENFPPGAASGNVAVVGAPHSYWAWIYPRSTALPGTLPADDFDHDGISNLLEYAFGLSPDVTDGGDAASLPAFDQSLSGLSLTYFRRTTPVSGLTFAPQFSSDLHSWTAAGGGLVTPVSDTFEQVTVTDPVSSAARRFGRVRVSLAE